jgi:hypothetical protein
MTATPVDRSAPLRRVFRTAVRDVVVLTVVLTVLGAAVGSAVADQRGLLGGLLGGAVVLLVGATTPVTMLLTAGSSLTAAMAAVAGGWLAKTVIVLVGVLAIRGADLVDTRVFGLVVVVGLLGSVAVDGRAVLAGRVPYLDVAAPVTDDDETDEGAAPEAPDDVPHP